MPDSSNDHPHALDAQPEDVTPQGLREGLKDYAVITLDPAGNIIGWSSGAESTFGYSPSEIIGQSFRILFTPEDLARNQPTLELERARHEGKSEDERWHVRKDGVRLWVSGMVHAIRNEAGEVLSFSKIARDITTQKLANLQRDALLAIEQAARIQAERARDEAERKWKDMEEVWENIPALVGLVRLPEHTYVFANRRLREEFGTLDPVGKTVREAHAGLDEELLERLEEAASTGQAFSASARPAARPGGEGERYFDIVFQPIPREAGPCQAVLIFALEITERKQAEALAEQRAGALEDQAALLDVAFDAIMAMRMDGTVEVWNRGAEALYGWKKEEAQGKLVHALLRTRFPRPQAEIEKELVTNGEWAGELKHRCRSGAEVEVSSRWVLRRVGGKPSGWLEINRDITERKRLEAHLRETQKLESLGVLAGGIAHDFNNLLTGIIGNASLATEMLPADSPLQPILESQLQASERAAFLTRQMLAYAGKGQFMVEEVDLAAVVRDAIALAGSAIPKNVSLRAESAADLPPVRADATQLQQIAMNLIMNAAEAIPEKKPGSVVVRTAVADVAGPARYDVGQPAPGRYVLLEVRDNGSGIDPAIRGQIFDPFFTTKFTGRGLGLAAAWGIVRSLGGAIQIESAPGAGSTFRVLFPADARKRSVESPARAVLPPAILVVDDEEIVRRTAEAILKKRGYRVLLAEEGQAAIELFRDHANEIALVLLDLTMPGMDGHEAGRN